MSLITMHVVKAVPGSSSLFLGHVRNANKQPVTLRAGKLHLAVVFLDQSAGALLALAAASAKSLPFTSVRAMKIALATAH